MKIILKFPPYLSYWDLKTESTRYEHQQFNMPLTTTWILEQFHCDLENKVKNLISSSPWPYNTTCTTMYIW